MYEFYWLFFIELGIWHYLYFLWFLNSLIAAFIYESFYLAFQVLFSNIESLVNLLTFCLMMKLYKAVMFLFIIAFAMIPNFCYVLFSLSWFLNSL